ncbi:MAG: SAM-dependent methyltransferase [Candidatus Margulisiibacteriota bacterium]|nr:MAG: hypothetical protein A2X43_12655 [Candidatus Margulisbacteria bacterium GWD2_39_127]OGI02845.1 MAG: hypothetical protein A2X42_02095 [Candidatus Margulisbacteria bacterium GWF2_38_17]OGI09626.1 MAG: hypothetical protein A2X41_04805 [Candidatus Margulisbacteria bacterium GWE2_39_32]PZM83049.1 MAG: SAM-dependent methyltransferase [Candidatus Margulisiibacteriota bacterium]HAR63667.1 SAM-dependent methyltransferase [Candidatus Margulisiibacteriota bacterium]
MKKSVMVLLFATIIMIQGSGAIDRISTVDTNPSILSAAEKELDVPYVPTDEEVVNKMLNIANIGSTDILYDLGCGDGRIVVTAAKQYGTKGIGVDIDSDRIKECHQNAALAKVEDRVEFLQQDLFLTDFSKATVLTMYLLPSVNLKLRPKILSTLKPGTRVVSHDFDMGEWKADQVAELKSHTIYFWIVPANATGTWSWSEPNKKSASIQSLTIDQEFQNINGNVISESASAPIKDAKITGDKVQFTIEQEINGQSIPLTYVGKIVGNSIEGTIQSGNKSIIADRTWKASREPSTATTLEGTDEGNLDIIRI